MDSTACVGDLPTAVSWPDDVGQAIFRPPFLGLSLTRVSSAVLKRAAQSPRMLPDFSGAPGTEKNDHWSKAAYVQDHDYNCQWSPPPVALPFPHRRRTCFGMSGNRG